jgi:quercetin dioxygenase-like cupin family protein
VEGFRLSQPASAEHPDAVRILALKSMGTSVFSAWNGGKPLAAHSGQRHIGAAFAQHRVAMQHPIGLGTQTIAGGGHVREHAHDRKEGILYVVSGKVLTGIKGENHAMAAGSAFFIGKNRDMFVNEGEGALTFVWLIVPNSLEDCFRLIGRPRQPDPEYFTRPANVLEIERQTVFAVQSAGQYPS